MVTAFSNIKYSGMAWTIRSEYLTTIMDAFVKKLDDIEASNNDVAAPSSQGGDKRWDGVRIIKSNKARTTLSAPFINGQKVIVKMYHRGGWFERIKYLFLSSRVKVEWDAMNALLNKGISTSIPLAYGERRRWGFLLDGSLIIKEISDCIAFQFYIERLCSGELSKDKILQKRVLIRKLADFIRQVHEKSIDHRDFHGGNILVTETNKGEPVFHLIDLHKARVCKKLSLWRKVDNLANICDTPRHILSKTDCLRLIKHYLGHDNLSVTSNERKRFKSFISKVFKRAARRQAKRFRSATKWCLKVSNNFTTFIDKNVRVYYRKGYDLENILNLINKLRCSDGGKDCHILKRSSKSTTFLETLSVGGLEKQVVVKYNRCRSFFDMIKKTILGTRSMRAWIAGNGFIVRGIPTPQPIALVETKYSIFTKDNFLITEYLGNLATINKYVLKWSSNNRETFREKTLFVKWLAAFVKSIHDNKIHHGDLSGKNILVKDGTANTWHFFVVDLDSVTYCWNLSYKKRMTNLSQLNNYPNLITLADRVRFLKAYHGNAFPNHRKDFWTVAKLTRHRRNSKGLV